MPQIPIGGQFYKSDSLPISAQEVVNLYANIPQATATTKLTLFATPGIVEITTAGSNVANRGQHTFAGKPYFVQGDTLYRVDRTLDALGVASYTSTAIGGTIAGSGRVIMADNGSQLCILAPDYTNQKNAYIYTGSGSVTQISDNDFDGPASSMCFLAGYFVFTKADGRKFFISELRDGTSYISTDFADAESDPDESVGVIPLGDSLLVFGTKTFQQFQNVGGAGFPFQSIQGSVQRKGLSSAFALMEVNDYIVFLGGAENETPSIWITEGGRPQKLSTTAIDNVIAGYSDTTVSNCFAWKYSEAGAQFVAFTFPEESTFVYDFATQLWHTRESLDSLGRITPCRVSAAIEAYGGILVGDLYTNQIGILDRATYSEYGVSQRRRFVTPHLDNDGDPFWIDALELVCETGVGLTSGQGADPKVSMSYSSDGGRTFSERLERSVGKIGEFTKRVVWNSLGRMSREVCFKFEVSDPVKWVFLKLEAKVE